MNLNENRLLRAVKHPEWVFGVFLRRFFSKWMSDRTFIKWEYFSGMKKFPDLENPTTFNEKLQWLKLNDIHPEYSRIVDKAESKKYVKEVLGEGGEEFLIPTLGVWNSFNEIDFSILPNQFVLKTTHDSGGVVVIKDKINMNLTKVQETIQRSLNHNFYYQHREYPYKDIKPRILAEKFMVDESGTELKDYKFFCFNGEPKFLFVATDRPKNTHFDFFDMNWKHLPITQGHPNSTKEIKKPVGFENMKSLAQRLSKGFPHVRVDLYDINGHVYFGELTFFHFSGNVPFEPEEWDYKIGEWLKLPI